MRSWMHLATAAIAALLLLGRPGGAESQRAAGTASSRADLVVTDAAVLDVRTGRVAAGRTVVVSGATIAAVLSPDDTVPAADRIVDAAGGLVTPGLVDAHGHLAFVLGDSVSSGGGFITRLDASPDSLRAYRSRYAAAYLPHGVTTVRDVGSTESDLGLLTSWTTSSPGFPDFFPSGGALVSPEPGRQTFPGHVVVRDPADARQKVRAYHELGFRSLKLYWRLREPEFRGAIEEAVRLGMNVTGHVDFHVLGMDRALDLGLRAFEHAYTVGVDALTDEEYAALWQRDVPAAYGARRNGLFHLAMLEAYNQLGLEHPRALSLIQRLAETGSTVSSSLHIFAQQVGLAPFRLSTGTPFDDVDGLTAVQLERAAAGYRLLAGYVRQLHEAGVRLTLGPDWMEPGRTALSEMLLLHQSGIPMADVLGIATLNGAEALGLRDRGAVEPGMRADLVLFRQSPLDDPMALFGPKLVVAKGRVVAEGP